MITSSQVRAARALLGWSAEALAERAGLHRATIQRMERLKGPVRGYTTTLDAVLAVFDDAGIQFILENGFVGVVHKIDDNSHASKMRDA